MLDMIYHAKLVVGPVGFIVPMCIALGTPAIIIHGGEGGLSSPQMINAPGEGHPRHLLPQPYCRCRDHHHQCNKTIDWKVLQSAIHLAAKS